MHRLAVAHPLVLLFASALARAGCGEDAGYFSPMDGAVGSSTAALSRCLGGTNGDNDFCSPGCTCAAGQGDCDGNSTCDVGLVCTQGVGAIYGLGNVDVCTTPACGNRVWDADECGVDCGGTSACGGCVPTRLTKGICGGTNGGADFCINPNEPCEEGEGDCDNDGQCAAGLICERGAGVRFGLGSVDVCVDPVDTCTNGVWDVDECGVDCGGTSACGACPGGDDLTKNCAGTNGGSRFCNNPNFPCAIGEGDCDFDSQCEAGLVCERTAGGRFGLPPNTDVCVDPADDCTNGVWDVNECGVDCGGTSSCGMCIDMLETKNCDAAPGDPSFCRNPNFPCLSGEGDCDDDSQCAVGLTCLRGVGVAFGFTSAIDVCAPATCDNDVQDGMETGVDCGGPDCGACPSGGGAAAFQVSAGSTGNDQGRAIATDASGNIYVTGTFRETVDFGGGNVVSAGGSDIFVASYDSTGAHRWSNGVGDVRGNQIGLGVTVDSMGDVIVVGYFQGTVNFGGTDLVSAINTTDIFVVKYTSAGAHVWSRSFGTAAENDQGWGVATDGADNVVVTGLYRGAPDFGGGALPATTSSFNIFLLQLNSSGTHVWSAGYGDAGTGDFARDVDIDSNDNIYVTGSFENSVDFGGGALTNAGDDDGFVASFTSGGAHRWSSALGDASEQQPREIAITSFDEVVIGGWYQGSITTAGCGTITSSGGRDVFIQRYTSSGSCSLARGYGGTGNELGFGVEVDSANRIYVGGYFDATTNFGVNTLTNQGGRDAFIIALQPNGSPLWTRGYGSGEDQIVYALTTTPSSEVAVSGAYRNRIRFVSPAIVSAGAQDIFVAQVTP